MWTSFSSNSNRREREALAEFFSDPSRWGDCRLEKENVKYPDFKHKKKMRQAVWVGDGRPAPWVAAEPLAMAARNGTTVVLLQQQLDIFAWNRKLARFFKAGQHQKAMELYQQLLQQQKGNMTPDRLTFVPVLNFRCSMHVLVYELLKKAGVLMSRSCNVVVARLMCLWGIAWLTYLPNVAAWKMLRECLTRCHPGMWSLGPP